jgi:putative membrane protein
MRYCVPIQIVQRPSNSKGKWNDKIHRNKIMVKLLNDGLLSDTQRVTIGDAIGAAEAQTSGEIYCVIAHKSGDYWWTCVIYAIVLALLAPIVVLLAGVNPLDLAQVVSTLFNGGWSVGIGASARDEAALGMLMMVLLQAIVLIVVSALGLNADMREALTPAFVKRQNVHRAALEQFLAHGIHLTAARTGVLIFASLSEHQAEIIADTGIYKKVDPGVWSEAVGALLDHARRGDLTSGIVAAVGQSGAVLAQHFPGGEHDINELPNRVVII